MLAQRVCKSRTSRRLDDGEFRAFIAALCLAGDSPLRGYLLVSADEPCTPEDIADEAGVAEEVAVSMIRKLHQLGTLATDDGRSCLYFPKWGRFNPAPRPSDSREATRERKRLQRAREAATKIKAKETTQPRLGRKGSGLSDASVDLFSPPPVDNHGRTTGRKRTADAWHKQVADFIGEHYPTVSWRGERAIEQAVRAGAGSAGEVHAFIDQWWPEMAAARAA